MRAVSRDDRERTTAASSPHRLMVCILALVALCGSCRCNESGPSGTAPLVPSSGDAGTPLDPRPERVVLVRVVVEEADPQPELELYPQVVAKEVARTLTEAPWFESRIEDVSPTLRPREAVLHVAVRHEVVATDAGDSLLVTVEAELRWEDGGDDPAPLERIAVEHTIDAEEAGGEPTLIGIKAMVAREVARAAALAAHGLIAMEGVRGGDDARVIEALSSGQDPTVQRFAIDVTRSRKLAAARSALEQLLGDELAPHDAVIGALVAIGDPASVRALTELPTRGESAILHTAIEAIGVLGGEDAVAYLEVVATGHPEETIRSHALAALADLEKRGGNPPTINRAPPTRGGL